MKCPINNQKIKKQKEKKFHQGVPDLFPHPWVETEILDRYVSRMSFQKEKPRGPLVSHGFFHDQIEGIALSSFWHPMADLVADPCSFPFPPHSLSGFIDSMFLHWFHDPLGYLRQVAQSVIPCGIYAGGFLGGGSGKNIRDALVKMEIDHGGGAALRFIPTIRPESMPGLLSKAGFCDPIIETVCLQVHYESFLKMIGDIRRAGENAPFHTHNIFPKSLFQRIDKEWPSLQPIELDVVFVTATAPSP